MIILDQLIVNKMGIYGLVMLLLILAFIAACIVVPIMIVKSIKKKKKQPVNETLIDQNVHPVNSTQTQDEQRITDKEPLSNTDDKYEKLGKIAKLRDDGILTQQEFEDQKKLILNS